MPSRAAPAMAAALLLLGAAPTCGAARVITGLENFLSRHTSLVAGKRVGLVTNQTGVDPSGRSAIDLLHAHPGVNLVALFAPEHGIRGKVAAGEHVESGQDPRTGLPVISLYGGKGHKPPKEAMDKLDALIFDIQDVGSRAYTYIWHMAECMKACAEQGKTMIVLDRPNPYGANVVDGPVSEPGFLSFIGLYPVPRVYGLTIGELAWYLNVEEKIGCKLVVVPMSYYKRGMDYRATGLPWTPPSPNIPSVASAWCFAATGALGETKACNIGVGSSSPFQVVAVSWLKPDSSAAALNALRLPGVRFDPIRFKGKGYGPEGVEALRIVVTDPNAFRPATVETAILHHLRTAYPGNFKFAPDKVATFDKAVGTDKLRKAIMAGTPLASILASWRPGLDQFDAKRRKYFLYK